jgi:hypothetical protein
MSRSPAEWTISIIGWSGAASTPIHASVRQFEGHRMTFAELMVLFIVGFSLYLGLKPLRVRIERMLLRLFGRSVRSSGRVIDITPNRKTDR